MKLGPAISGDSSERLLPKIAERIRAVFPDLGGRAFAVADARITRDNMPTLPLAMVALSRELPVATTAAAGEVNLSQRGEFEIVDAFVVEFWLKTERYKKTDGSESPFWTYYDFEAFRNRLLSSLYQFKGPLGERIWYRGLGIEADEYAVVLTFEFSAHYNWCPDEDVVVAAQAAGDGTPIDSKTFSMSICTPKMLYCPDEATDVSCDDCQDRLDAAEQLEKDTTP